MREHKAWAELSQAEVAALKRKQCCKCAYFSRNGTTDLLNATCDYILDEVRNPKGHRRPCEPRDCVKEGKFEYAATKVAMGNASPKIKELADYVTTDMFHYGIRNGLEHLGLI